MTPFPLFLLEYYPGKHSRAHNEFLSLSQNLTGPSIIQSLASFTFDFKNVEKPYKSFHGNIVRLRQARRIPCNKYFTLSSLFTLDIF